jgi:hypothetical protein
MIWGFTMRVTWYVSFDVRKRDLKQKVRGRRLSQMFAGEAEAKKFARAMLDEGRIVVAGTINPHSPKQLILSQDIDRWLTEP